MGWDSTLWVENRVIGVVGSFWGEGREMIAIGFCDGDYF